MRRDMIHHISAYHRAIARRNAARSLAIGLAELLTLTCGAIGLACLALLAAFI